LGEIQKKKFGKKRVEINVLTHFHTLLDQKNIIKDHFSLENRYSKNLNYLILRVKTQKKDNTSFTTQLFFSIIQ
jgi:hypothetical protein